jgi:oxygen-independent coproporphyrinogen-3 oxidase
LYFHIPFCKKKCPYCDFYSVVVTPEEISDFVKYLVREIQIVSLKFNQRPSFHTVYFGGGTPSLLSTSYLEHILNQVYEHFSEEGIPEVTLEMNPEEASDELIKSLNSLGINRVSLGCQSFLEDELRFLGRIHTVKDNYETIDKLYSAGIENINMDIIFGLPGQTKRELGYTLKKVIELNPQHISVYNLSIEKGTLFFQDVHKGKWQTNSSSHDADLFLFIHEYLTNQGFEHYEISNYAMPLHRSKHNMQYWSGGTYIGVGPSAHSYIPPVRCWNPSDLTLYKQNISVGKCSSGGEEIINGQKKFTEELMLSLRISDGLNINKFSKEWGKKRSAEIKSKMDVFQASSEKALFVFSENGNIGLTQFGFLVYDEIVRKLIE